MLTQVTCICSRQGTGTQTMMSHHGLTQKCIYHKQGIGAKNIYLK